MSSRKEQRVYLDSKSSRALSLKVGEQWWRKLEAGSCCISSQAAASQECLHLDHCLSTVRTEPGEYCGSDVCVWVGGGGMLSPPQLT